MVRRLRLALSRLGPCQPLGQHRIRRRRQGLQAQGSHHWFHHQKRHRLSFQKCWNQEFFHDQIKGRSDHQVIHSYKVFRYSCRHEVFDLFRQQGSQDQRSSRKVFLRSRFRQHQVFLLRLQPFIFIPFLDLQQAVDYNLQQAVDILFQHQVLQLQQWQLQVLQQPLLQHFRQLLFRQLLQEFRRLQWRRRI